jgi:hypothetical protein
MNQEERKIIFTAELKKLREERLIGLREYTSVKQAYERYYNNKPEELTASVQEVKQEITANSPPLKQKIVQKPKKKRSAQEIRDRNITAVLILGVVLLLIGGLVLATSSWEVMTAIGKTALIASVCGLFFGISWLSGNKLTIEKTAFAFLTLGSLFLPIVILSAGYFEVFGFWLSTFGPGKYLLGFITAVICLPLYSFHAKRQNSRLFVWFTYLTLSIGVGFLFASLYPPIDLFYLGIVCYNACLLFSYYRYKKTEKFAIFLKELPVFAQVNLVLSTLLMLLFFESEVFYSFNVLLTAAIYLAMIFTAKRNEYHFIFTILFVYGIYQLIEHSFLQSLDVVLYALIGFVFIGLQKKLKDQSSYLKKAFQFTSAAVSFCTFLFISYKGIALRFDEPSWLLFFGYLIICANYIFLAYETTFRLFSFLAPIFFVVAGMQMMNLVYERITANMFSVHTFAIGTLLFTVGYFYNKWKFTLAVKQSSLFVSIGVMLLTVGAALLANEWYTASSLFVLFGIFMYYTNISIPIEWLKGLTAWLNPISWMLAGITLYPEFTSLFKNYETTFGLPFHFGIVGLILFGITAVWKAAKRLDFESSTFWTAQAAYTLGLILLFAESINPLYVRTGLLLGGIAAAYLMFRRTNKNEIWMIASLLTLASYLSVISGLRMSGDLIDSVQWIGGAVLLLIISETLGKRDTAIKNAYFYTSHLYLPIALFLTIITGVDRPLAVLIAIALYGYSVWKRTKEWERKLFLYVGFTMLPLFLWSMILFLNLDYEFEKYSLFSASFVIFIMWYFMNDEWKERIKSYFIPFSILGTALFSFDYYEYPNTAFGVGIIFITMTLYVVHKSSWHILTLVPLLMILPILNLLSLETVENDGLYVIIYITGAFVVKGIGDVLFRYLYERNGTKLRNVQIDWYAFTALLIILSAHDFVTNYSPLWLKELPALALSLLLFLQIRKVKDELPRKIIKTIAAVSLLYPYYVLLGNVQINEYMEAEAYLLPWIVLTIVLSKRTWANQKQMMSIIQWIVLVIIAALLVQDALRSNTIYDALIAGGLSLLSVLGGLHYKIKSYFFIGTGMLLLNVMLQTRPFWGNTPWWAYLLIAGFTLIAAASFYEWQKQQKDSDGNTLLQKKKEKWKAKWKQWK